MSDRVSSLMGAYYELSPSQSRRPETPQVSLVEQDVLQMRTGELRRLREIVTKDVKKVRDAENECRYQQFVAVNERVDRIELIDWIEDEAIGAAGRCAELVSGSISAMDKMEHGFKESSSKALEYSVLSGITAIQRIPESVKSLLRDGLVDSGLQTIKTVMENCPSNLKRFPAVESALNDLIPVINSIVDSELVRVSADWYALPQVVERLAIAIDLRGTPPTPVVERLLKLRHSQITADLTAIVAVPMDSIDAIQAALTSIQSDVIDDTLVASSQLVGWTWPKCVDLVSVSDAHIVDRLIPSTIADTIIPKCSWDDFDQLTLDLRTLFTGVSQPSVSDALGLVMRGAVRPLITSFISNPASSVPSTASSIGAPCANRIATWGESRSIVESMGEFVHVFSNHVGIEIMAQARLCLEPAQVLRLYELEIWIADKTVPSITRLVVANSTGEMMADMDGVHDTAHRTELWSLCTARYSQSVADELKPLIAADRLSDVVTLISTRILEIEAAMSRVVSDRPRMETRDSSELEKVRRPGSARGHHGTTIGRVGVSMKIVIDGTKMAFTEHFHSHPVTHAVRRSIFTFCQSLMHALPYSPVESLAIDLLAEVDSQLVNSS